jgi:GTP-binding protein
VVPVIAIVGRPNVGKSTLFNELTKSRQALVVDLPGVTRDRLYGEGKVGPNPFIVIDTGGLGDFEEDGLESLMEGQSWQAIKDADILFFMVDGRIGRNPIDETLANKLRHFDKPIYLLVNKTDGLNPTVAVADFYAMGIGTPIPIAASQGRGVTQLIEQVLPSPSSSADENDTLETVSEFIDEENLDGEGLEKGDLDKKERAGGIKIAIIGRPNVGKSTLVNRILGEERVVVFDEPGTTRDSIYIPFERHGKHYTIIDTAGVRKRARVKETVEKFSVVKTLQAVEACDVVLIIIDAREGVSDQDLGLLGFVLETGRSLVLALNKWDGLTHEHKLEIKKTLRYKLAFADYAKIHFISALHGTGVGLLFDSVQAAYDASTKEIPTGQLNKVLAQIVVAHPPPMVQGRRIKLRYAHIGGHRPPIIVIHGNQTDRVPDSYQRYLMNAFRKAFRLIGTPIRLEFVTGDNPFKDRHNILTPRQEHKRKRLREYYKKSKK